MALYLIILFLVSILGIRFCNNTAWLAKKQTTSIKGFFIMLVFFSHIRVYFSGEFEGIWSYRYYDWFLSETGQLMVTMFLFYSGFGIMESYQRKVGYLNRFVYKRVFLTWVHLVLGLLLFVLMNVAFHFSYSMKDYVFCWIGWTSIGNSNWYIFDILVLYILTYVVFMFSSQRRVIYAIARVFSVEIYKDQECKKVELINMIKPKELAKEILNTIPIQNIIMFESVPDCCGNTKAVFDEMIKRGLNQEYKMVWRLSSSQPEDHKKIFNVRYIKEGIRINIYRHIAKLFISENSYLRKERGKKQYAIHLTHGGALKCVTNYYKVPEYTDELITLSPYLLDVDAKNNNCDISRLNPLGYPRNDVLLERQPNFGFLFPNMSYKKIIYWLPTFRQHKNKTRICSSISIPVLHDEKKAIQVNNVASECDVLIVVKPHFAQDVDSIRSLSLSNIVFIDDSFLFRNHITNYEFLAGSDALLTDYSSVYYDYLLKNAPIGLCWEDYKEFEKREGFIVNTDVMMAGGEKIYSADDLCAFIKSVSKGEDRLKEQRSAIRKQLYSYGNDKCTGRVTDYLETILKSF